MRILLGALFISHGWPKLMAAGGGPGFARALAAMGFAPGAWWAWLVTIVEFGGGICLVLGVLVRPAALLIAIEMTVAIFFVNFRRGFYWTQGGYEVPLAFGVLAVVLAVAQPSSRLGRALTGRRRAPAGDPAGAGRRRYM